LPQHYRLNKTNFHKTLVLLNYFLGESIIDQLINSKINLLIPIFKYTIFKRFWLVSVRALFCIKLTMLLIPSKTGRGIILFPQIYSKQGQGRDLILDAFSCHESVHCVSFVNGPNKFHVYLTFWTTFLQFLNTPYLRSFN
jgi:hypothetical protein